MTSEDFECVQRLRAPADDVTDDCVGWPFLMIEQQRQRIDGKPDVTYKLSSLRRKMPYVS